jgi:hypothetical protein
MKEMDGGEFQDADMQEYLQDTTKSVKELKMRMMHP